MPIVAAAVGGPVPPGGGGAVDGATTGSVVSTAHGGADSVARMVADVETFLAYLCKHIFSFLDGPTLASLRLVSWPWRSLAEDESLWKALTLRCWRSLATDAAAWPLASGGSVSVADPFRWRRVYPIVARGAQWRHLESFVVPDASLLYFEPEAEADVDGFTEFIDYLTKRSRAGLALDDNRRFIFVPPCDFARNRNYAGDSLLGVVQDAYPPMNP
ncbi:hypothetical protein I4F81_000808 [Pyropia yezoensis]|uniref:Uncharacterized protein n=1 Tax=Pyropia yezoensis TaxID=2788 RepID=A0ACC3BJV9_PYRYE|nr:hypothetical protein I4F81_000808 [Neopyropia yezoensis]